MTLLNKLLALHWSREVPSENAQRQETFLHLEILGCFIEIPIHTKSP